MYALQTGRAAFFGDLGDGVLRVFIGAEGQHGIEGRVHRVVFRMTLHRHSRHGQEPRGEVARRGLCALLGVGIEAHRAVFGPVVLREEALVLQPQAEILAHLGFQHRAAQRKLAGIARPVKPFVRRDVAQQRAAARQRGAYVVAAQHDHLVQRIGH